MSVLASGKGLLLQVKRLCRKDCDLRNVWLVVQKARKQGTVTVQDPILTVLNNFSNEEDYLQNAGISKTVNCIGS